MTPVFVRIALVHLLVLVSASALSAQYRRQVEEVVPTYGASLSIGALLSYEETISPVPTPEPDQERRGVRSVGTAPAVSVAARFGRGIALYGNFTAAFPGAAELSGTDPLTGLPLTGEEDMGMISIASVGLSFVPVSDLMGLRINLGPAWLDMGSGGSYLGVRLAAAAKFLEIGDLGGVMLAWDGYFAGGQDDQDEIEYQIRGGLVSGLRLGFELEF